MTDRNPTAIAATKIERVIRQIEEAERSGRPADVAVLTAELRSAIDDLLGKKPH